MMKTREQIEQDMFDAHEKQFAAESELRLARIYGSPDKVQVKQHAFMRAYDAANEIATDWIAACHIEKIVKN
jgi:hypothetical protein